MPIEFSADQSCLQAQVSPEAITLYEIITVNVEHSRVFPWVGCNLGPNNHWEALQFQY